MTERIGADEIAARLRIDPPTTQQRQVIEAPLEPALVVAGAGSGKTETMAFRVLWLIANGLVRPEQVLGLTFTRKAAGELGERLRERIGQLRQAGMIPDPVPVPVAGNGDGEGDADPAADLLDAPTVSTYNAFAGAIFRENAALVGQDGDAVVLGEASAWLLARELVRASDDPRLVAAEKRIDDVASAVVRVAAALAENVADAAAVGQMAEQFTRLDELPPGATGAQSVEGIISKVRDLPVILDLAVRYDEVKRARGYQQFSDQLITALRVLEKHPRVGEVLRDRYRVVILDEYQDTSVVQTTVLAKLFRGRTVMAVGDPHQAIYGWRGASAANLAQFAAAFDAKLRFSLSISWRNGVKILDAANRIIRPLATDGTVAVELLSPRPHADAEAVELRYPLTVAEEATEVAQWFRKRLNDPAEWRQPRESDPPGTLPTAPTAALLLRARSTLESFISAFQREGVPYHVLGVGGLLAEPGVADLVAALTVIDDPGGGSELVRLLAGSRWRIGLADLLALRNVASWLAKRDLAQQELETGVQEAFRESVVDEESASIIDALDFVAGAKDGHTVLGDFSELGLARLREAGLLFRDLRRRVRLDLSDLCVVVIQALDLDIEVDANESRPGGGRAFEAFFDALEGFQALGQGASLRAFLGWLREAETRDRLTPRSDPPEEGCVQIVTIHGAKGLEWDLVAVPRLVTDELPRGNRDAQGWVAFGQLPYEFRGDKDSLPEFAWRGADSRKQLLERHAQFKQAVYADQLLEDRRLAYVAVTRARRRLLLSGSFWSTQVGARAPSEYLRELADAGVIEPVPDEMPAGPNPTIAEPELVPWPRDPLGGRRERVMHAAELVRAAPPEPSGRWGTEATLLLAERERAAAGPVLPAAPTRIPASRFSDFVWSRDEVAGHLLRPMPEKPYRATRLGTQFHSWVENRPVHADELLAYADGFDSDVLPTELDGDLVDADAAKLAQLRANFERSEWAGRNPVEVEREVHLPFDGRIAICKIDAVYELPPGDDGLPRYEIVDWKTGKPPSGPEDVKRKSLQLALYKLAYSKWARVEPERIDAAFYFVADDLVIRPHEIADEVQLLALWRAAFDDR